MKSKGFLLATAGGVASLSGAQAADLPVKAPHVMPPPLPLASWEGFYVGVNAGAAWQSADGGYGSVVNETKVGIQQSGHETGFIGGGQIGYNWQRGMFVFGFEADISGLSGKIAEPPLLPLPAKGSPNGLEARIDWLSTFRGRAGWLVTPNALLYATGGLAVGGVKNTWAPQGIGIACTHPANCTKSVSKTQVGWTVGGGLEYMLTRNWTVGLEGLYVDLGNTTGFSANTATSGKTGRFKNTVSIGRVKVNYKF